MAEQGYQVTPFGFVHASCVTEVSDDDMLDQGVVQHADGSQDALAPCQFPIAAPKTKPTVNGWVEAANWTAANTPTSMSASWKVPANPSTGGGQVIFFFPSYENAPGTRIVQPVLQYGASAAGGGAYWAIASWYVTSDTGQVRSSKLHPGSRWETRCRGR